MGLNVKKIKGGNGAPRVQQEALDSGTYPARVVQIIDLGLQPQPDYQGQSKPPAHEIMLTYELLDEFCVGEDGEIDETKPRWISETFPLRSLESDLAKSTKRYKALDPTEQFEGDFTQLVELPCMVTLIQNEGRGKHAGKTFVNVASVSSMRPKEAARANELVNPPKVFLLDEPDMEVFKSLPDWLQEKVQANLNFQGSALEGSLEASGEEKKETAPKTDPKAKRAVPAPAEEANDDEDEQW